MELAALAVCILAAAAIGYLARSAGLCMVRAVVAALERQPLMLLALLVAGFWVHLAAFAGGDDSLHLIAYPPHWRFVVGGLLFGIGAAANGGCAVGTISRGFAGDLGMIATASGWLIGAAVVAGSFSAAPLAAQPVDIPPAAAMLAGSALIALAALVRWRYPAAWSLWRAVCAVGLLSLVLFVFEPNWDPSACIMRAANWLAGAAAPPSLLQVAVFASLGAGVLACALGKGQFKIIVPSPAAAAVHLVAGILMGVGLALALGGNDTQLLLRLPTLSASALLAVAGMGIGIWLWLLVKGQLAGHSAAG